VPTALITGGHAGIGFECAKQLASRSRYNLVLAGRSMEQIKAAAQQLRTDYGIRVSTLKLDTSSLSSVRDAATKFRAMLDSGEVDSFEALLYNAGGYFGGPLSYSKDGYETTVTDSHNTKFTLRSHNEEEIQDPNQHRSEALRVAEPGRRAKEGEEQRNHSGDRAAETLSRSAPGFEGKSCRGIYFSKSLGEPAESRSAGELK
jgi:NAD(P)-dependent dehydrogenase (short-subunit alcohol dehydrogenase family)